MAMLSQTKVPAEPEKSSAKERRPWALRSLPPLPAVALKLLSLLDDIEVPIHKVVALLRTDPAISAEILRVSNSALYGLSRRIDNISHAIVVLGTDTVKRLALTLAWGRFSRRFMRHPGLRICWNHSVACAVICEELAAVMNQPRDRAYSAGLLHDMGRLALLACYPIEYGNMLAVAREHHFDELQCEWELFDIDHCTAGEWLAQQWNLPPEFAEAMANHHSAEPNDSSLLSIVTAGNRIADVLGFNVLNMPPEETVSEVISKLPIRDREGAIKRLEGITEKIQETLKTVTPART
jgi:putative nucleotidyltransferase with HDIG domain